MKRALRGFLSFIGAVVVPFNIVLLEVKQNENRNIGVVLVLALSVSAISIAFLPASKKLRCILGVIWIPMLFVGLYLYGLDYVCNNFYNNYSDCP